MDTKSGKLKNKQLASYSLGKWQPGGGPGLKMSALEVWREAEGLGTPMISTQQEEAKKARLRKGSPSGEFKGKKKGGNNVNGKEGYTPEGPYLEEDIKGGDPCVEEEVAKMKIARSGTVKYFCGERAELVNVVETRSCHYEITVTVPGLCEGKGWKKEIGKQKVVMCAIENE
jgi:hypothetical protein